MRLAEKAIVITGAGSGIGRACALRFAREGARLILASIDDDACATLVADIESAGGTARFVHTDVSRRADNERAIDECVHRFGGIDVLCCNAGINLPKRLPETTDEDIARVLAVNLNALMYASRYAIPVMQRQGRRGSILFTASKTGLVAQTDSPVYCASKGGAVQLARALALDYAADGITVNALCPGIIDTPMLRECAASRPDPAAAWRSYEMAQPIGRLGTAEECADAALWLVSDEARFVTGIALPVDGGFTAA